MSQLPTTMSLASPTAEAGQPSSHAFVLLLCGVHLLAAVAAACHQLFMFGAGASAAGVLAHVWPSITLVTLSLGVYAFLQQRAAHPRRDLLLAGLYILHCAGTAYLSALEMNLKDFTIQHSWIPLIAIAYTLLIAAPLKHHIRMQALTAAALPAMVGLRWAMGGYGDESNRLILTMMFGDTLPIWIASVVSLLLFVYMTRQRAQLEEAATQSAQMGSYILERKLGEGGMGEVWKARHAFLARPAALKVIRTDDLDGGDGEHQESADTIAARFDREARVTAALTSPHTVRLYDFGQAATGTFFYAMEYLKGMDLEELVEKYGPQPQERVIHIMRQVCDSLAEAHMAGLIHRDIKPANIMLCRQGTQQDFVKVLDFGLVMGRASSHLEGLEVGDEAKPIHHRLTEQGIIRGTPACMSPEQAMADKNIDHRTDIYALGCVAYYLLTGRDVFEAPTSLAVLVQHLKSAPKLPSQRVPGLQVHEELEALVMQCLAKDPAGRPQRAQDLVRAFDNIKLSPWTQADAVRWYARLGHLNQEGPDSSAQWVIPPELRERLQNMRSSEAFVQGAVPGAKVALRPKAKPQ